MMRYFYACDVEEIPRNACSDQVTWNFEKTSIFSVRNTYRLAMRREHGEGEIGSSSTPADGRKVWKTLWSLNVPEKVKVFTWKIATQANKCYRHIAPQATCEMCSH